MALRGYISHVTFQSESTGFTVAQFKSVDEGNVVIVGAMPGVQVGEQLSCEGEWTVHPSHGRQFQVKRFEAVLPESEEGIIRYLSSGLIHGIGPVFAKRIVDKFGRDTISVIDETPDKLLEVSGLGQKKLAAIKESWQAHRAIRELMIFLQGLELPAHLAQKIFKVFDQDSIAVIQDNPYALIGEVWGVGFKTADRIAQKLDVPVHAAIRIRAGVMYVLNDLGTQGHVCYPLSKFLERAAALLGVGMDDVERDMQQLVAEDAIVMREWANAEGREETFVWAKPLAVCEAGIVKELRRISAQPVKRGLGRDAEQVQGDIELSQGQREAIEMALKEKVSIVTGGPGTGKSTATQVLLNYLAAGDLEVRLAAPTGRAAKRMSELTGWSASTLHSLLQYEFKAGGFRHDSDNQLECDYVIVDEASMIDTVLMYHFLKAVPDHAQLLFIGDVYQLPSVGPGQVLRDLIDSEEFPVQALSAIFRQAAGSQIIQNAHEILQGRVPEVANGKTDDFFFLQAKDAESIAEKISDLMLRRLPDAYGLDPFKTIQVLTPQNRGPLGTIALNEMLQGKMTSGAAEIRRDGKCFHVGDKVMQLKNDYEKEVFNGDIGWVSVIDEEEMEMQVDMGDKTVHYRFSELDVLNLAYAATVHKYQGSECAAVIMPLHGMHSHMLFRNLLYTAVTRGKQLLVLVGTREAFQYAVQRNDVMRRYTGLCEGLKT